MLNKIFRAATLPQMPQAQNTAGDSTAAYAGWRLIKLGALAMLVLLPVTLPVPVLRELVQDRFGVSVLLTSAFMSVNMVGAVLAAPLAGMAADRFGRRPRFIGAALLVDALCFVLLTQEIPFVLFLLVRFFEGCAHIFALSLLLGIATGARPPPQRGWAMGITGAGLLLGVALGAPLGGFLGAENALRPLQFGAGISLAAALFAALWLRETAGENRPRPRWQELRAALLHNKILWLPLLFAFADRFTVGFFTTTFPLYLRGVHEFTPPQIGLLISVFMLPFALLSFPAGAVAQRFSRAWLLCGGSALYGLLVMCIGFGSAASLMPLMLMCGCTAAVMFIPSLMMTTELTPESARTTAMGAFNAAGSLGFIIGPLTGGAISQLVAAQHGWLAGYQAAFGCAGAAELLLALLAFRALRAFEKRAANYPR